MNIRSECFRFLIFGSLGFWLVATSALVASTTAASFGLSLLDDILKGEEVAL